MDAFDQPVTCRLDFSGGEFRLLVAAVMICCGVWPDGLARAASKAAGVSAARTAASVRAYPAG